MPLKEKFIIPQSFPRNVRHTMPRRATEGSTRVRRQKQEGRKTTACIAVSLGKTRQGSGNSLGLASLNNSNGPWGNRGCL